VVSSSQLSARLGASDTNLTLAGTVVSSRSLKGRRGPMAFVQMSDAEGVFEITVFSELLYTCRDLLETGNALLVQAEGRMDGEAPRITATGIRLLDTAAQNDGISLNVYLGETSALTGIKAVLGNCEKGSGQINLIVPLDDLDSEVEILLPGHLAVTHRVKAALKAVEGVEDVQEA
jgi:DNA polymerase-3 subunit alpha